MTVKKPDKSKKGEIDILGMEIEHNLPHWLSDEERNRNKEQQAQSEQRKKAIREKHRAAYRKRKDQESKLVKAWTVLLRKP